jgi:hypothetical protein
MRATWRRRAAAPIPRGSARGRRPAQIGADVHPPGGEADALVVPRHPALAQEGVGQVHHEVEDALPGRRGLGRRPLGEGSAIAGARAGGEREGDREGKRGFRRHTNGHEE